MREHKLLGSEMSIWQRLTASNAVNYHLYDVNKTCPAADLQIRVVSCHELLGQLDLTHEYGLLRILSRSDAWILSTCHLKTPCAINMFALLLPALSLVTLLPHASPVVRNPFSTPRFHQSRAMSLLVETHPSFCLPRLRGMPAFGRMRFAHQTSLRTAHRASLGAWSWQKRDGSLGALSLCIWDLPCFCAKAQGSMPGAQVSRPKAQGYGFKG